LNNRTAVARWAAAASAIPYTDEICQSVVVALFQIAPIDLLRPHIPIEMWGWIKRRPILPYTYNGVLSAAHITVITHVRRLGDIDILKSYFVLVWGQCAFHHHNLLEMESSIRENFGVIGMDHHRKDLIQRLDHVLLQLNLRGDTPFTREVKAQCTRLKNVLLEVDGR
jgi:hypothetical protein